MDVVDLLGTVELVDVFREFSVKMPGTCVWPWKQYLLDQGEDAFHLALVVDVFGEDVFVERIAGRAMDEEDAVLAEGARPFGEELPASFAGVAAFAGRFQLIAGPEDGPFGGRIEAFGVEHGSLIVIAEEDDLAFHDQIDAFAGVGAVADDIAEAIDFADVVLLDVFEDSLEGFQVAMNIADDGLHARLSRKGAAGPEGSLASAPRAMRRKQTP